MSLYWYLHRLSNMPLPEIPWRLVEKGKKLSDKYRNHNWQDSFTTFSDQVFEMNVHWNMKTAKKVFPTKISEHIQLANNACRHRFSSFGIDLAFNNVVAWHLDPVTQKNWPMLFWGDINYNNIDLGGVKFVWEINRLYFLFSLGMAFRATGEKKYASKALWLIQHWLDNNPYPMGINWASGIELAVRIANLIWMLSFLKTYDFKKDDYITINRFVWIHAQHLYRYPSKYSSSNNHLLAEGFGLFLAGRFFPGLTGAEKWLDRGKKILETEVSRQILPDGGSFEYSTTYLSFVFDFFLLFFSACRQNNISVNQTLLSRMEMACRFIRTIMNAHGQVPNIGDQDNAVLVNFGLSNQENFLSILNTGAVLFDNSLFTGTPDIKTWLITGKLFPEKNDNSRDPSDSCIEQTLPPAPPCARTYRHSGLAVIRQYINTQEILFVGNAMPLGMAPLYAHGHLDALSFTLSVAGLEFFVDIGTYCYHGNEKWRRYFRSTSAHNTISINGQDMSRQTGDFMFKNPYTILQNQITDSNGVISWQAALEAGFDLPDPVKIQRKASWYPNLSEFVIQDTITAKKPCRCDLFFHLHPFCNIETSGHDVIITRENIRLIFYPDKNLDTAISKGKVDPISGWYSPEFNKKNPTFTIQGNKELQPDENHLTTQICIEKI